MTRCRLRCSACGETTSATAATEEAIGELEEAVRRRGDPGSHELGYAVLQALDANPKTPARATNDAERAIEGVERTRGPPPVAEGDRPDRRAVKYAFFMSGTT